MKKIHIYPIVIFLLGITFGAQAQDPAVRVKDDPAVEPRELGGHQGSFHFGGITAVNSTWIKFDNEEANNEHYKYKKTFKWAPIGLALGYKFNDRHDLQAEAYISNQGQKYELVARGDKSGATIGEKEIDLTYLQVPLLWKFTTGDATRFNVHIGPQVGFLLRGEEVNRITSSGGVKKDGTPIPVGTKVLVTKKGDQESVNDEVTVGGERFNKKFNKVDPYLVLGFGVEKDITDNLYLSGVARFHYGFSDIREGETTIDITTGDKYILRYNIYGGLQVGLHYIFNKP